MKTTTTFLKGAYLCAIFCFVSFTSNAEELFSGIFCPDDVYVDCDDELWDLSIYGNAYYKDYNGQYDAGTPTVKHHLNSCNSGYITRTWKVKIYGAWYSCSQTIHVQSSGGGVSYYDIDWPDRNTEVYGCNPNLDPDYMHDGRPTWGYADCSMMGTSYKDKWFTFSNTCKKLIREWTVMDWCTYDPVYNKNSGIWKYSQTIKVILDDVPDVVCVDEIVVDSYNCYDAEVLAYPLELDPLSCGGDFTVNNNSPYADSRGNDISGVYPIGETWVTYTIQYGCGTKETCKVKVVVNNAKAPTPYCYAFMTVSLMGMDTNDDGVNDEGMAEIWAKDLNAGSFANCVEGPLKYSFSADTTEKSRVFTCDELGENELNMYVTDVNGNQSWCIVRLDVQNNGARIENCVRAEEEIVDEEPVDEEGLKMFNISGLAFSAQAEPIHEMNVSLTNMAGEMMVTSYSDTSFIVVRDTVIREDGSMLYREWEEIVITDISDTTFQYQSEMTASDEIGIYGFTGMAEELSSIEVKAYAPYEHHELDIYDVEILFRHLVRDIPFDSPYQHLAGDVDGDKILSFMDMRHMLMYITGRIENFPAEFTSIVIPANHEWESPEDALTSECPDALLLSEITEDHNDLDFNVIRLGDLSLEKENARERLASRSLASEKNYYELTDTELTDELQLLFGINLPDVPEVKAFPNPFSDQVKFSIYSPEASRNTLSIYTIDGKEVIQQKMNINTGWNEVDLPMQELNTGLYYYRLTLGSETMSGKLIKK